MEGAQIARVQRLRSHDYKRAFMAVEPKLNAQQLEMLLGHACAPRATLSMTAIAVLGAYDSYKVANLQYGRLGRLFADALHLGDLPNRTFAIAEGRSGGDERGHFTWTLRDALRRALADLNLIDSSVLLDGDDEEEGWTSREAVVLARRGQGVYRERMLELWGGRCAVSGCGVAAVLIASHAKPWASSTDDERMNAHNGLLLAASIDRLFDQGLIAFADDGSLLQAPRLDPEELRKIGLSPESRLRFVAPAHRPFLAAHRRTHGFPTTHDD